MFNSLQIFLCVILTVQAVTASASSETKTLNIGVLYWSMNISGQVAMRQGLEARAEELNRVAVSQGKPRLKLLSYVAGDGAEGIERQIQQMLTLIQQQPDVIVVQPTDNAALAEPLRRANRAKIPVVAYDQYISGGKLASYVTSDNYQAGYLDGEYIASLFPRQHRLRLVLVEYPLVSSTVERLNGFLDGLRDQQQKYTILKTYQAVEPSSGTLAGQEILRDFPKPDSIDAVFTVNDGGGLNVVNALAEAGRKEIVIATIDGDPQSVTNIRQGRLTRIDTAQFCGPLGATALDIAYRLALGEDTPAHVLLPVFPITRQTLSQYPGWLGPIPPAFVKPWPSRQPSWDNQAREKP